MVMVLVIVGMNKHLLAGSHFPHLLGPLWEVNTKKSLKREHYLRSEHKYQNVNTRKSWKQNITEDKKSPSSKHHNVPKETTSRKLRNIFMILEKRQKIDIHSGQKRTFHLDRYDNPHNQDCWYLKPAKLVVVPGALIGGFKVHLLRENRKPKLIGVQFKL